MPLLTLNRYIGNLCKPSGGHNLAHFANWSKDSNSKLANSTHTAAAKDMIHQDGLRSGAMATLLFAIIGLLANILLPRILLPLSSQTHSEKSPDASRRYYFQKFSMMDAWTASHIFTAVALFSTILISSQISGTIVIASLGVPWALTLWIPYAFIGAELASIKESTSMEIDELQVKSAGAILSIHNMAISAPQIMAALICAMIFWVAETAGSSDGVGWTMRIGGVASLVAAWLSRGLKDKE
jgi:solute carrier family 45 protein 1/2/4